MQRPLSFALLALVTLFGCATTTEENEAEGLASSNIETTSCTGAKAKAHASCLANLGGIAACDKKYRGCTSSFSTKNAEACGAAVVAAGFACATAESVVTVGACGAAVLAACGTCVDRGCIGELLHQTSCIATKKVSGPYPDGSCCQVCTNGKLDVCDPNLCPKQPAPSSACNNRDAYGKCLDCDKFPQDDTCN